jgi:hypothetical protein
LEDTHAATLETQSLAIVVVTTPSPIIEVVDVGEVMREQEVLSDTEAAEDCDGIIESKAAILLDWECFKTDCVFRLDLKGGPYRGHTQKRAVAEDLGKKLDPKPKEEFISRESGY